MIDTFVDLFNFTLISRDLLKLFLIISFALFLYLFSKLLIHKVIHKYIISNKIKWDNYLLNRKVFLSIVFLPSLILIFNYADTFPKFESIIKKLVLTMIIIIMLRFVTNLFNALNDIYKTLPIAKNKPIKGFIQIILILLYIVALLIIVSIFTETNPWVLISGLGAMTAILILVFQETILSFVASIRITSSGIIQIGDWLEVPKFGADGEVIDIALHNIQIQNWDKTITNIPTHKLMADSFKNWQGMVQSGGRRIMRNVLIDINSIKFCDNEMIDKFSKIDYLKDYIKLKQAELNKYNLKNNIDDSIIVNGRRLTNIGMFRAYILNYLKNHPYINKDLILLIRHLSPDSNGLPLQIYVFSNQTAWVKYEEVQADIFDHLLAVVNEFDLRVFQNPSGSDFKKLSN
ncbi:MAG: mechanosensitive ion channel family protein [Candidatus Cloacimonetes bacterium]|nr:mechanosensitive ion channel family protein [Candidatus Cloacimonadota bacterium]